MANKDIKSHLTFLVNREMQIKTTMRYRYTPTIHRTTKSWQGCGATGTLMHC